VLAVILVGYLMIIIDTTIVITGLPSIEADLGFSAAGLSWVQNAYALTFGGLLLLGARAGDLLGRRRVFIIGLALFSLASLGIGAAPTAGWLVGARAVQGVAAAILVPATLGLLTATFIERRDRTRATAAYGAMAGIGSALGLVLGGLLTTLLSWRLGFLVNLPVGIALILAARRYVSPTPGRPARLDVTGALLSTVGMVSLVYGIVRSADAGWSDPITLAAIGTGLLLLAVFVGVESRAAEPIMPLRLFASPERAGAYSARFLFIGAMITYFLFLSQFLQGVYGYTPLQAGLAFLPMTIVNFIAALAVPRLTYRFSGAVLMTVGIAVTLVGMAWLSRLSIDSPYLLAVALPTVLIGAGQGLAFGPLTAAGVSGVAPADAGAASGLVNASQQLGGAIGLGILVTVGAAATTGTTAQQQLASSVQAALTGGAVLLVLALVVVLLLIVRGRPRNTATPQTTVAVGAR
jgi:EmrB/QacA subfamily drug resistance transporter